MKGAKRWMVWFGGCTLALVLLIPLFRALDIDPLVWVAQQIGRAMDERRQAERDAHQREVWERLARDREEATRGVPYWMNGHRLSRAGSEFQIAVKGDQVGFYQFTGETPSPDVWFIDMTVEYHVAPDYALPIDTARRLRINEAVVEPFRIERAERPYDDALVLQSISYPNGENIRFYCIHVSHRPEFREATTVQQIARIEDGLGCRTFLSIRNGIRLMVQFPIDRADIAPRALTQAIAMVDHSIVDHPQTEK